MDGDRGGTVRDTVEEGQNVKGDDEEWEGCVGVQREELGKQRGKWVEKKD